MRRSIFLTGEALLVILFSVHIMYVDFIGRQFFNKLIF